MGFRYNDLSTKYLLRGLLATAGQDEAEAYNAAQNIEKYATDPNLKPEFAAQLRAVAAQIRDHANSETKFKGFLQEALKELSGEVRPPGTAPSTSGQIGGKPVPGRPPSA